MLGNANEVRKSRVCYSRLPTEFLILETQLQATIFIVGIPNMFLKVVVPESIPNMFLKVVGIPANFDDSQLLTGYHWHFHSYPMILSIDATDYLNFKNKRTHTRTHTHARWRQFTV